MLRAVYRRTILFVKPLNSIQSRCHFYTAQDPPLSCGPHPCLFLRGSRMCCWGHSVAVWHSSVYVPPLNLVPSCFFIYCLTVQICAVCDIRCLLTQIQSADSTLLNLARPFLSVIQLKNRLYAQQNRARAAEQPLFVSHDTQKF